jgi:hypothetical protein
MPSIQRSNCYGSHRAEPFEIFKRFPEYKDNAKKLFAESKEFKSICEDYCRCSAALRYWTRSAQDSAAERKQEYAVLLQDLEDELYRVLEDSTQLES